MSNKTRDYRVIWSWKQEGNRVASGVWHGSATTVPRAISKLVRELNDDAKKDGEEPVKASEIMVLDCRTEQFDVN